MKTKGRLSRRSLLGWGGVRWRRAAGSLRRADRHDGYRDAEADEMPAKACTPTGGFLAARGVLSTASRPSMELNPGVTEYGPRAQVW